MVPIMNTSLESPSLSQALESILSHYGEAQASEPFGGAHPLAGTFEAAAQHLRQHRAVQDRENLRVTWSMGQGKWASVPWIALLDQRETTSTQRGVYVVLLFRQDMSGAYLTFNQGVTELKKRHGTREARKILQSRAKQLATLLPTDQDRFQQDGEIDLHTDASRGRQYESSTAAYRFYQAGKVPHDQELFDDLQILLDSYDEYLTSDLARKFRDHEQPRDSPTPPRPAPSPANGSNLEEGVERVIETIQKQGYVFEPWQVAQYITAVRTKPFVILAGITGTGKSKLPRLVAEATGGETVLVPVRPDWTDSAEVLGYTDLQGVFRPGVVLEAAHSAIMADDIHLTCIIDEMNLARVEHYFAEVLSRIEDRRQDPEGGFASSPLIQTALSEEDAEWGKVRIPPNLAIVGTVNMDESAHGFSRKVLDRAFTLELSEVDLGQWSQADDGGKIDPEAWPVSAWWPRATRLSELPAVSDAERETIHTAIIRLTELNQILVQAQLQVGYRTRDEVALFLIHADQIRPHFRTESGDPVDPFDLALQMKVLPRIAGGSGGVRRILLGLMGWTHTGTPYHREDEARDAVDAWDTAGRPSRVADARFPGAAGKVLVMWDRLRSEGYTSYWL
jgi:hypothetical protein